MTPVEGSGLLSRRAGAPAKDGVPNHTGVPVGGPPARAWRSGWPIAVLLVGSAILWAPRLSGPLDLRYDAGVYYLLGTSLAQGEGYRILSEPGALQGIQYPPALPFAVAVAQWFAGTSDPAVVGSWLRIAFALVFAGYVVAVYLLARRFLAPALALVAALITLLHVHTSWMSDLLFTEVPFGLVSILFLLVARMPRRGATALAGILGGVAFLLRSAGIALLLAWVGESLLQRRLREAAVRAVLALIPVLGWQLHIERVRASDEFATPAYEYQRASYQFYNVSYIENLGYVDPFVPELGRIDAFDLAARVITNVAGFPLAVGEAVSSRAEWVTTKIDEINDERDAVLLPRWLALVVPTGLGLLVLGGIGWLAWRREWLIVLYTAGSLGIIAITPWPGQFERYLTPLTPILAIGLLVALPGVGPALRRRGRGEGRGSVPRLLGTAILAVVLVMQVVPLYKTYAKRQTVVDWSAAGADVANDRRLFFYTDAWASHDRALRWLASHATTDDIVATSTPHWFFIHSGIRAVMPPFESDAATALRLLDDVPVRYLVVDELEFIDVTRRYGLPVVQRFPAAWELVHSTPDGVTRIYHRTIR